MRRQTLRRCFPSWSGWNPKLCGRTDSLFSLANADNSQRWKSPPRKILPLLLPAGAQIGANKESRTGAKSCHFMSVSERTTIWFFRHFSSRSSGSQEPGRPSDVRPPGRVRDSLPRHAWVLNARSRRWKQRWWWWEWWGDSRGNRTHFWRIKRLNLGFKWSEERPRTSVSILSQWEYALKLRNNSLLLANYSFGTRRIEPKRGTLSEILQKIRRVLHP